MEDKVTCKIRSGSLNENKIKRGSIVQFEVSVEVGEHIQRLVRCAHFLLEDGDKQQVSREGNQNREYRHAARVIQTWLGW